MSSPPRGFGTQCREPIRRTGRGLRLLLRHLCPVLTLPNKPQPTTAKPVQTTDSHLGYSPTIYTPTPPATPPEPKSKLVRLLFNPKLKPHQPPRRSGQTATGDHPQEIAIRQIPLTKNNSVDDLTTYMSRAGLFNVPPLYPQPGPRHQDLEGSYTGPRLEAGRVDHEATSSPYDARPFHTLPAPTP